MITPGYSMTSTERVLPRLALDFTTGVLDPRVTVTRLLNTATRINSSGLVEGVNANLPRFDYDPVTFLPKGLLIEETRINYVLYSEDFTQANWAKGQFGAGVLPIVTPNYATAPNGTNTATRLQLDAGPNTSGDYSLLRQAPLGLGGSVTRSLWAKSNTGTNQVVTFVATTPFAQVTITPTWQRIILPNSTAGSQQFDISVGGDGATPATADITVWGAQLEAGAFATSYIPTTLISLTRNSDAVTMTGTNFSDWYTSSSAALAAVVIPSTAIGTHPIWQLDDTTANEIIALRGNVANPELYIVDNGTPQAQLDAGTITANTQYGLCAAFTANSCAVSQNGATPATTATATMPTVTQARIGSDGSNFLNGTVRTLRYWPQRILNAETQAFSKV